MKLLVIFVLSLMASTAIAQMPEDYAAYSRTPVFDEQFSDNERGWQTSHAKIRKGNLVVTTSDKDAAQVITVPVNIDNSRNYDIETTLSIRENLSGELMGLTWNTSDKEGYYVGFNRFNNLVIFSMNDGNVEVILNDSSSSVILPMPEPNVITVRKYREGVFIFLNKQLVSAFINSLPSRDSFGYFTGKSSKLVVSDLWIHYLGNP